MKISLLATFVYSIGTVSSASSTIPSAQEIAEGYLRRVADEALSEVEIMKFRVEKGCSTERVNKIKNVINTVVEAVISDHRPHYELNQIAHCLNSFRINFIDFDLWICVGLEIYVLPEVLQEMFYGYTAAKLIIPARKVGMSRNDLDNALDDSVNQIMRSYVTDPADPERLYRVFMSKRWWDLGQDGVKAQLRDPQQEELLAKVASVDSEAKLVICRLRNLIINHFHEPLMSRSSNAFAKIADQSREIIAAIVEVCVGILRTGPPSLASLAFFLDRVELFLRKREDYGTMLLETAFLLSKRFGVRVLQLYPRLTIPLGWSERKVLALRKIIGCLIHFNQHTEGVYDGYDYGYDYPIVILWSRLASVTDDGLIEQAASVLSLMNKRILISWEDARLFYAGDLLEGFAAPVRPSSYARLAVHSFLVPQLLFRKVSYKLDDFPRRIDEFLQYYPRYEDVYVPLVSRANSILANFRGKIPLAFADQLRRLPASLLRNEVDRRYLPQFGKNLQNIVDEFVLPVFGLIEEAMKRHDSFLHPDIHLQLENFFRELKGYYPVAPLREKLQTLTSRIQNL